MPNNFRVTARQLRNAALKLHPPDYRCIREQLQAHGSPPRFFPKQTLAQCHFLGIRKLLPQARSQGLREKQSDVPQPLWSLRRSCCSLQAAAEWQLVRAGGGGARTRSPWRGFNWFFFFFFLFWEVAVLKTHCLTFKETCQQWMVK